MECPSPTDDFRKPEGTLSVTSLFAAYGRRITFTGLDSGAPDRRTK